MKQLGNTFYVSLPDVYLSLDGENIVVLQDDAEIKRIPLHNLESIVTFGYKGTSSALMRACAERGIAISYMTMNGRFLARVEGGFRGNIHLRKEQFRVSDSPERSCEIAKSFLYGKFYNSKGVLARSVRDHAAQIDTEKVNKVIQRLNEAIKTITEATSLETLRGIEGVGAEQYFSVFDSLILQKNKGFSFDGRNRRPPTDRVNALLSFCYSIMTHDCASFLETVGLDPYAGFLHRDRPGRQSLALDLLEEFRSPFCDRFVLTLINNRQVTAENFTEKENGAFLMDDDTRKAVLTAWQKRKQEEVIHPYLNEKIAWGMIPYSQALLLSRYLRGDLDAYPPFLWK